MTKFDLIAGILFHGLSVWDSKEKGKYIEELVDLVEERDEELNKPSWEDRDMHTGLKFKEFRDDNRLNRLDRRMQLLGEAYLASKSGGKGLRDLIKS